LKDITINSNQFLLKSVAEELRLPLVQISRLAELSRSSYSDSSDEMKTIESSADLALQLLESYILGVELGDKQKEIELSPITIGAVMNDVAHQVYRIANQNNCDIELLIKTSKPIMGNYEAIKMAYLNIAHSIILANSSIGNTKRKSVIFAVYGRGPKNMAGVYGNDIQINKTSWEKSMSIFYKTRQKIPEFSSINASGFFVASSILDSMSLSLNPSKYKGRKGLVAGFPLSQQLSLI
jgi:light-regulated signal transduction histidine kinase (bacteriophytochrome)